MKNEAAKKQRGFTLIELLVVIIVQGILAAIALPAFLRNQNQGEVKRLVAIAASDPIEISAEQMRDLVETLKTVEATDVACQLPLELMQDPLFVAAHPQPLKAPPPPPSPFVDPSSVPSREGAPSSNPPSR